MKLTHLLLTAPLFLLATTPQAQQKRARVGFVDVEQVVAAVPGSASYLDLRKRVNADLEKRQRSIQDLSARAARTKSAADRNALASAQQSFVSAQKNYQGRLAAAFKPVSSRVDGAIANVAKGSGFTVVFDKQVAARSGLVVYANIAATDLTPAVLKVIKK